MLDHEWRSRNDAEDLLRTLERGQLVGLMSARTRELFGLIPVSLLVAAGFAAVLATRSEESATPRSPTAPSSSACAWSRTCSSARGCRTPTRTCSRWRRCSPRSGSSLIYRIDPDFAREQAQWFVVGLVFFCGTIVLIRDHHVLERYRYTIAAVGIALLVLPRLPGIGEQVNGAFLAIKVGPIQFQPAEFAKLAIIIFLASYLRETGDILVRARLRPLRRGRQVLLYGLPAVRHAARDPGARPRAGRVGRC